jgi:bacillolysin
MKHNRPIQVIFSVLTVLVLLLSTAGSVGVGATSAPGGPSRGGDIRIAYHPATGMLTFVGAEQSRPIAIAGAVGANLSAQARAESILAAYAPQFGVGNPNNELTITSEKQSDGRQIVRYQQVYQGVPVLGGELILNMNEGGLVSMNGEVSPSLNISTSPAVNAGQARETALVLVAKYHHLDVAQLTVSEPALWIYDQRLLEGRATLPPHLVWRVEVRAGGLPIRELVLVNALKGNVSLHFNQVDTIWSAKPFGGSGSNEVAAPPASVQPAPPAALGTPDLWTYNSNGTSGQRVSLACHNNVRGCLSGDAANAHGYAYDTYFAYSQAPFNRDSIDGAGMAIISNVNWYYVDPLYGPQCPNAFWDGDEMTYCAGLAADDVVAHELTHGVTQNESNLFYMWESGAINESLSDVWGEYVDQNNSSGNDSAAVKWKMGEDTVGMGVIRDMKNPPAYHQPDSMTSAYYCESGDCYNYDGGGVHTNSGVNNKATYLMVDGGIFNTKTVTGLGWAKTITVYYEAQTNLLSSGAGYYDLYYALYQACVNKIGTSGIVLADCQEVRDATDAVKMNQEPATGYNPNTTVCPSGNSAYLNLFTEDFETGTDGWTFGAGAGSSSANWSLWSASPWYSGWGPNTHGGLDALYADDDTGYYADYAPNDSWAISPSIVLAAGVKPYLYFAQAYGFEYSGSTYYDGGVLEYSTNGGAWTDASALYSGGQNYKGTLNNFNGNPIGGRKAFAGDSHGYVESRFNLTSLAGQTVQFRWRMGTDNNGAYWGWWLDDVQIKTCISIPSMPTLSFPANNALLTDYTPTFNWSDSTGEVWNYDIEIDDNSDFSSPVHTGNTTGSASDYTPFSNLPSNAKLYWRVRALNIAGGASAWTASRYFRTALPPPNSLMPGFITPGPEEQLLTRRPTFVWETVTGAATYTVEVSTSSAFSLKAINATAAINSYTHTADLAANTLYYWRVKANGTNGPSLYSQVRMVRTANPPSVPTLSAPANNTLVTSTTPLLNWNNSTVPVGTTFRDYNLEISTSSTFDTLLYSANVGWLVTDSEHVTLTLANATTYYWRVRSVNTGVDTIGWNLDDQYSAWSAVRSIRVPFAGPTLNLPADLSVVGSLKPTFTWNPIPLKTSYNIQISKVITFSPTAVNATVTNPTYTPLLNLTAGTVYYWRVRANGPYGPGLWSATFQFTTP